MADDLRGAPPFTYRYERRDVGYCELLHGKPIYGPEVGWEVVITGHPPVPWSGQIRNVMKYRLQGPTEERYQERSDA